MDAVKFINELNRMCKSHDDVCTGCPLIGSNCPINDFDAEAEKVVLIVEKWSEEHPKKTNGDKIWEMIPSYLRSTTIKTADSEAFDGSITAKDHIELRIVKDWWDAEYKEESND